MVLSFKVSSDVSTSVTEGVLRVSIDRPEKRNPLSLGVLQRLNDIFTEHADDVSLRLAVVTGAGDRAFASGGDLVELAALRLHEEASELSRHGKSALNAIRRFPVPVIARLNGVALGGGAELALACDMRFAAHHASIGFIHSRLGIVPSWGGSLDLARLVGYAKTTRLLARAEILNSAEAKALGLIDEAAEPDADFDDAFEAYIDTMKRQPVQVMRAIKSVASGYRLQDRAGDEDVETEHFATCWAHADHWAAVDKMASKGKNQ